MRLKIYIKIIEIKKLKTKNNYYFKYAIKSIYKFLIFLFSN